ncbi:lipid-binding SYLF domain-containing protein [Pectinatus haikarae]|uniref:Lipid-binding SYLF domain-containing protein n=1 Tax=Pectinatus haikarae TaxID=349096 RepID=A0ABT9Y8T9_9FIRM|nr:YSC84-related protein [Pectinatus haikarae]MDQ0204227.1 lipid-binding SYLF domain-containing protein [Pectinatus haikarae]
MKKIVGKTAWLIFVLVIAFASTAAAASKDAQRDELRQKTAATLDALYKEQPKAQSVIEHAAGYAVFNSTGLKLGLLGSAHGRGMAVNNSSGQEIFMRMQEYQAGLGLGVKEYAVIFVFANEDAWNTFVEKGWSFGAQATAAANDGVSGDSLEGAVMVSPGVWIYQMTTKGLAVEVAVKGTNYYKDKNLN